MQFRMIHRVVLEVGNIEIGVGSSNGQVEICLSCLYI